MRIWVDKINGIVQFNFQPDSPRERKALDDLLTFTGPSRRISVRELMEDFKVKENPDCVAELGGHESQRWIKVEV